jgi:Zn-dependent protease with chaperone function
MQMSQWLRRYTDPTVVVVVGTDIDERNYYSHQYWLRCGIAAAAFLFAMVYFGWWFSRYISTRFYAVCDQISGTILPQTP